MKNILVIIGLLLSAGVICASARETPDDMFSRANTLYEQGDYSAAITEYENILVEREMSGPLYFNLANSYFREGRTGLAILNYMRAEALIPRDADLRANMRFAKETVGRRGLLNEGVWGWKPIKLILDNFTVNELTYTASFIFTVTLVCVLMSSFAATGRRYFITAAVILSLTLSALAVVVLHKAGVNSRSAVVLRSEVEAKFGPFETGGKFFELSEGMVIEVMHQREEWAKIRRSDGKIGWIKKNDFEKVMGPQG